MKLVGGIRCFGVMFLCKNNCFLVELVGYKFSYTPTADNRFI